MRTLTAAATTAITSSNVPLLVFIEMDFAAGFLRLNNSAQTFTWDGNDWIGAGVAGSIDAITEGTDLTANGIGLTLSGIPTETVSIALNQKYQGRAVKIWYAPLTAAHVIIADPIGPFQYRMDTMDIELGDSATIRVQAESRLIDWERALNSRYTHEEQQRLHSGDLGLQFVPQMVEKQIRWGY